MKNLVIRIDETDHLLYKAHCLKAGVTMAADIRDHIRGCSGETIIIGRAEILHDA